MKTFLITITILGAIIYGMLEINEYYDDRGACSWGLFDGGYYLHKERLESISKALIKEIIQRDKYARTKLMQQQELSEEDIAKKIKSLDPQYDKEREKMAKYCNADTKIFQNKIMRYNEFTKSKIKYEQLPIYATPSKYCKIGNENNYDNNGFLGFSIKYNFDKESLNFFNEVNYITKLMRPSMGVKEKPNAWYPYTFYGIKFADGFNPCKTRYHGGESTGWLQKYGKVIHTYNKTKQIIAY